MPEATAPKVFISYSHDSEEHRERVRGLSASHGLCVVTTRHSLPDLRAFWQTTAREVKLLRLSATSACIC